MLAKEWFMNGAERLLAACHYEKTDTTPVWFMRQAGRCFPEYRKLREKFELTTLAKTPELSVEIALMPVQQLGVDGAVLFADIMLPVESMGVPFRLVDQVGPVIETPIRDALAVDRLRRPDAQEITPEVFSAVRLLRKELNNQAALIGFAGAPFTLACYLVEGKPSRDYAETRAMMFRAPSLWHELMERVTDVLEIYLKGQVNAGAQVIQLFDSWVGILSRQQYEQFAMPYSRRLLSKIR